MELTVKPLYLLRYGKEQKSDEDEPGDLSVLTVNQYLREIGRCNDTLLICLCNPFPLNWKWHFIFQYNYTGVTTMHKRNIFQLILLISLIAIFMIGCNSNNQVDTNNNDVSVENTEPTEEKASFPLEITDSTGNTITLESEPNKIISVMPSNTEILFALELGEKVIAVTENDTYPEEVLEKDTVGDFNINVEKIISLEPDLVLAHASSVSSSFDAYEQIMDAGINVYFVTDAQSIEATYESISEIGKVTGANEAAEQLITEMEKEFTEITTIAGQIGDDERKNVLFEISPEPEIYTGGKGTFFNELIELIGANNSAGELDGWAQIDPEAIVDMNPDVILTLYGSYVENATEQVLNRDGFSDVNAVKTEQVYNLDEDIVSRPGPRLVEGAKAIAKAVYPDFYTD